jgi:hypothetical protein
MLIAIFAALVANTSGYFLAGQQLLPMKRQAAVAQLERQGFRVLSKPKVSEKPTVEDIDTAMKWAFTSSFDVRLAAPRSWTKLEFVEVSYCPADDQIASVTVAYRKDNASLHDYASLTRETTESLGASPTVTSDKSGTLSSVWKLPNDSAATAWKNGAAMGLGFSGPAKVVQCNLLFGTQEAKDIAH